MDTIRLTSTPKKEDLRKVTCSEGTRPVNGEWRHLESDGLRGLFHGWTIWKRVVENEATGELWFVWPENLRFDPW